MGEAACELSVSLRVWLTVGVLNQNNRPRQANPRAIRRQVRMDESRLRFIIPLLWLQSLADFLAQASTKMNATSVVMPDHFSRFTNALSLRAVCTNLDF